MESGWRWWLVPLAVVLFFSFAAVLASGGALFAQSEVPAASADRREVTPDEVNAVAREIWCPLCSGVRLDACELKACDQMKDVIAIKLTEGEDTNSIKAYFVEQYGPQVLGEPPREGFNWLAWILPAVAFAFGGYFFWRATKRMMQPVVVAQPVTAADAGQRLDTPTRLRAAQAARQNLADVVEDEDEYTQKLEEELAKYG